MPQSLTTQFPPPPLAELECIRLELNTSETIGSSLERRLRSLVRQHALLNYTWQTGHTFWRGRILETSNRYAQVRQMLWPPITARSPGRANFRGEAILYVGDHVPTVVAECCGVRPLPMQFIGMEIRLGEHMRFMPIGEISEIWHSGKSLGTGSTERAKLIQDILSACEPAEAERLARADQFLFETFAHPTRHDATAIMANEVRLKLPDVDGIMYRSVRRPSALNVAIQPQSAMLKCNIVGGFSADRCSIDAAGKCSLERIEGLSGVGEGGAFLWTGNIQTETELACFPFSLHMSNFDTEPFREPDKT